MSEQVEFEFSLTGLTFKYKGTSAQVGQALHTGIQQSLSGLMNTQRAAMVLSPTTTQVPTVLDANGLLNPPANGATGDHPTANGTTSNGHAVTAIPPAPVASPDKVKKSRKSGAETPKSLLRSLKAEGYFAEARTVDNIREKLRVKGHTNLSGLTTRLQEMSKKDELFRNDSGDGFIYKDTKFNDAPATPTAPVEPAE